MITKQIGKYFLDARYILGKYPSNRKISTSKTYRTSTNLPRDTIYTEGKHTYPKMSENLCETDGKVFVQHNLSKNMMRISFDYHINGTTKSFNLQRDKSEPVSAALERIKLNLCKINKSKSKTKDSSNLDGHAVALTIVGKETDINHVQNSDAWVDGAILVIDDKSYEITTNNPQVESIKLPGSMMKGFSVVPSVTLNNCSIENCKFTWYRQVLHKKRDSLPQDVKDSLVFDKRFYWQKISDEYIFTPGDDEVACLIRLSCTPSDGIKNGPTISSETAYPVQLGPTSFPFEQRHLFTQTRLDHPEDIRLVSYNILADLYADSDYSRSVLFGHCPPFALDIDYRKQILLKEISGYNADLICLQEVDKKEFERTYYPFFKFRDNFSGIFDTKGGQVAEGCATFFRNDKFDMIESHKTLLSQLMETSVCTKIDNNGLSDKSEADININLSHPILDQNEESSTCLAKFDSIRKALSTNEQLKRRFMDRHTIIQITLLKHKESTDRFMIVANTHLYFAPDADHVRLLQGSVCVKYLEYIKDYFIRKISKDTNKRPIISILFCGDMNSTPDCGLYSLVTKGHVSEDLPDWVSNKEESVVGLTIDTELRFASAYVNIPYTNYTVDFNGCLDYIYYDRETLTCENIVPLPKHEDVTAIGGLPSDVFPSDHLALVADLKLIK